MAGVGTILIPLLLIFLIAGAITYWVAWDATHKR